MEGYCLLCVIPSTLLVVLMCQILLWFFKTSKRRDIAGSHVLITGGSSGIGECIALRAAKLGANVTIVARNELNLLEVEQKIKDSFVSDKQKANHISVDLCSDYCTIASMIEQAESELGPITMLVNCAGMAICGTIEDTSPEDVVRLMSVNYTGTYYATKAAIKGMKERADGAIVIVASEAALLGIYGLSAYTATKFALRGFAESLDMEVKPYGISVTLSLPPDTDTPGYKRELLTKPLETQIISAAGGLYQPDVVAEKILVDALDGKFFSSMGLNGLIMRTLCCGMAPANSTVDAIIEVSFMGIARIIALGYRLYFEKIIRGCRKK